MKQLTIIGLGPRGLYALERLLVQLAQKNTQIRILVIEAFDQPGSGPVWRTDQPDSNWSNSPESSLTKLKERPQINYNGHTVEAFPSYHDWCQFKHHRNAPNTFPPRHKLGKYLRQRYTSLLNSLNHFTTFDHVNGKVINITFEGNRLKIQTNQQTYFSDDVLLTIGHQKTKLSKELKEWKSHGLSNPGLLVFENTYPISQFHNVKNQNELTIGIRGFGLAMIDVMRYLTINDYGNFKVIDPNTFETVYYKVKPQKLKLIPFSLYGLPLVPKPLNPTIDAWYKPTDKEIYDFKSSIETFTQTFTKTRSILFLTQPFAKIVSRVFLDLGKKATDHSYSAAEIEQVVINLLNDSDYKHGLFQDETLSTYQLIQQYIKMALGQIPVTLDYCIGQVWRHCQPTLYSAFSFAKVNNNIIETVIELNERSKRYSYGPPIESMQQMLALVDADILMLDYVKNPDIKQTEDGWVLKNDQNKPVLCSVMINSVLDEPKLLKTKTALVQQLLQDGLIQPTHEDYGIDIYRNAYVKPLKKNRHVPIAVLGRLAKGRVIGVDSISECFGPRIEDWAKAYVNRLNAN